ncbi:MAG: dienelactone hydrolase family protein [Actinobacteria bacterium]|nr:dienelactone hydrolase family protein [Actinomycetota bacterium]
MGEMVSFASNGGTTEGYRAVPPSGTGPGVIVVQEWWGLNDQIKSTADRFASEGFTALAPDFYHGEVTKEPDEAGKLMMALNIDQVAKDARGAAKYLKAETGGKVGVIGFCMGGQLALLAGTVAPQEIGAVVDLYGIHPSIKPDYSKMTAPVLALFAELDEMTNAEARAGLADQLKKAGVRFDMHVYSDCDHAFMNETRPEVHHPEHAEDVWKRVVPFFHENLR